MKYFFIFLGSVLVLLGIISFLFLAGCFAQRNEVVQKDSISYLLFSGPSEEVFFSVYKENTAVYDNVKVQPDQRYTLVPGAYRVEARHKGEVIAHRKLFFSDGQTQEIRLP